MKKSSILMILSACLIIVGIVTCVIGAITGTADIVTITPEGIQFIDEALQKDFVKFAEESKLNDLLTVGKGDYVTHLSQLDGSFTTITIDIIDADIEFVFDTSTRFGCEYGYYENAPITITESSTNLIIRQNKHSLSSFGNDPSTRTFIRIYIPKDHNINLLSCNTVSSDIKMIAPKNNSFRSLNIKSVSGSIFLDDIDAPLIELQTTSGPILARSIDTKACEIKSVSGDIELDIFCNQLKVTNTSGAIDINRFTVSSAVINTTSGYIKAKGRADKNIKIESTSGDVELTVAERPKTVSLDFQTVSGKCDVDALQNTMTGDCKITVETLSANFTLNFEHSYVTN